MQFVDIFVRDVACLAHDNYTPPWSENYTNDNAEWVVLSCFFVSVERARLSPQLYFPLTCRWAHLVQKRCLHFQLILFFVFFVLFFCFCCISPSYTTGVSSSEVVMWLLVVFAHPPDMGWYSINKDWMRTIDFRHFSLLELCCRPPVRLWGLRFEGQELRARLCCRKISDSIFWLYYFTPRWLAGVMPCPKKVQKEIYKKKR